MTAIKLGPDNSQINEPATRPVGQKSLREVTLYKLDHIVTDAPDPDRWVNDTYECWQEEQDRTVLRSHEYLFQNLEHAKERFDKIRKDRGIDGSVGDLIMEGSGPSFGFFHMPISDE